MYIILLLISNGNVAFKMYLEDVQKYLYFVWKNIARKSYPVRKLTLSNMGWTC